MVNVELENPGGVTNWVSWAYGPIANMLAGPAGEYMLADRVTDPVGERVAEGGSD